MLLYKEGYSEEYSRLFWGTFAGKKRTTIRMWGPAGIEPATTKVKIMFGAPTTELRALVDVR